MKRTEPHPVNTRMKSIINFYFGSLTEFGTRAGMSRESVSQYIRSDQVSKNFINAFRVVFPEINMEWVTSGEGNPFQRQSDESDPDCGELVETLIKANNYQAQVIDKLWKEKREQQSPFQPGIDREPSAVNPSPRLRAFAELFRVSNAHRPSMS